jgi:hypothetical protein
MTSTRVQSADDNHNDVFTAANRLEPAGKQACADETCAPAHLVRIGQGVSDTLAMFGKQVGVPFG